MGKRRKTKSSKPPSNWRHLFPGSADDGGKKQQISTRVRNRLETYREHGLSTLSILSSKSKKIACLPSKCHAVGLVPSRISNDQESLPACNGEIGTLKKGAHEENDGFIDEAYSFVRELAEQKGSADPKEDEKDHSTTPPLRPLYFEVPQEKEHQLVERTWVYESVNEILDSGKRGVVIHGVPGTGKTTMALQLVEHSCFGRKRSEGSFEDNVALLKLASSIVAYHFCQVDNQSTCVVSSFVHSLAAQMCQAPTLQGYREYLEHNPTAHESLSSQSCLMNPNSAFIKGIIEPLTTLRGTMRSGEFVILMIDSVGEAESHRTTNGDTIASFLSKHLLKLPPWFKLIFTSRTSQLSILDMMPLERLSLDVMCDSVDEDVRQYVSIRLDAALNCEKSKLRKFGCNNLAGLKSHLVQMAGGCLLYLKLTMDLIEQGYLRLKPNNFKTLPDCLHDVFSLHCNMRFPTTTIFHNVLPILSTCLVALNPLNLLEIYHSVNSLRYKDNLLWVDFLRLFKSVHGLVVKRMDGTYMLFHSTFRDWLLGKDVKNVRFQCNPEIGHAAIALRLLRVEHPLSANKLLILAHHMLKAKMFQSDGDIGVKYLQALLLLSSCENISDAFCSPHNIYNPNLKVSQLLLLSGASSFAQSSSSEVERSVFEICAAEGNHELLDVLLQFGININSQNDEGDTSLHIASAHGQVTIVQYLVERGASIVQLNSKLQSPLVVAALFQQNAVLEYLLDAHDTSCNLEADRKKSQSITQCLVLASANGYMSTVKLILDKVSVINMAKKFEGDTALTAACKNGQGQIVRLLLRRGGNANERDETGTPSLIHAVEGGFYNISDMLLSHGADVNAPDTKGRTPLHHAVYLGDIISAEVLINHQCDLNKRDSEGLSVLAWACCRGNVKMCTFLLQYPMLNINDADNGGRTPLHIVASSWNQDIAIALLERGASLEQEDFQGNRPLDYAVSSGSFEVVKILLCKGAKLSGNVWKNAVQNEAILLALFTKVFEDGKLLLQAGQVSDAKHRFAYALKKLEGNGDKDINLISNCNELKRRFLLELFKCHRLEKHYPSAVSTLEKLLESGGAECVDLHEYFQDVFSLSIASCSLDELKEQLKIQFAYEADLQ